MDENCSHSATLPNTASSESHQLDDYLRDNKRKRKKSRGEILQTKVLWLRTAVFSLEVLASGNLSLAAALH